MPITNDFVLLWEPLHCLEKSLGNTDWPVRWMSLLQATEGQLGQSGRWRALPCRHHWHRPIHREPQQVLQWYLPLRGCQLSGRVLRWLHPLCVWYVPCFPFPLSLSTSSFPLSLFIWPHSSHPNPPSLSPQRYLNMARYHWFQWHFLPCRTLWSNLTIFFKFPWIYFLISLSAPKPVVKLFAAIFRGH